MLSRVALVGSTGLLGSKILQSLLSTPSIKQITTLTRASSSLSLDSRVKVIKVASYDDETMLIEALRDHDIVISAISGTVYPEVDKLLLSACVKAGLKRFMPSEFTLDICHSAVKPIASGTLLAAKTDFAERLAELAKAGQIEYTTLVTGGLIDWALEHGFGGVNLAQKELVLFDKGFNTCTACTTDFVARAVTTILQMPEEETRNRRIRIAEIRYSGTQLLDALRIATSTSWLVKYASTEQALESGRQALEQGDVRGAYVGHVLKLNYDGSGAADFPEGLAWNKDGKFSIARKSLEDIVSEALERGQ